jgi:hypothetical protein
LRVTIGTMSSNDAAPLPRLGEVFFDVRGDSRSMRLSWYGDTGVAVFSIWQGGRCTGTFRLPVDELPRMMATLRGGPDGSDASHDVSGAHDLARVRDFGGEGAPVGLAPRDLPRDSGRPGRSRRALEDAATSYLSDAGGPEEYAGERTAAFPAPGPAMPPAARPARHADQDLPPAGRGRASDAGYDIPSPARLSAEESLDDDPLGMGYRGAEPAGYRDSGRASRGWTGPADDSRTDPGPGDPLSYRAPESRGYDAADAADYPAGDPLGYRPADDRDYPPAEGRDYRGSGGRHYAAQEPRTEGPGYGAEEGRGYPGDDDLGYAPGDPRGYAADDDLGYRAAEGRHYAAGERRGEGAGYRGGEGRHYAAGGEPGPDDYHSWSEPESAPRAYTPAWTGDYAEDAEYPLDSGQDPYGHDPRVGRRDRR